MHLCTLFGMLLLSAGSCSVPTYDESDVQKLLQGNPAPSFHRIASGGREIHYVATGSRQKPLVVFIHGTPGSWKAFAVYLADDGLSSRAQLVAVDRPGFGQSGYGRLLTALKRQAASLVPILKRESRADGAVLVGHSLGGSVAVRIAMDYPHLVKALVLVAPSLDPALEQPRWYNRIAAAPLIRRMIPEKLSLANREVMVLSEELHRMMPLWKHVRVPTTVIQGMKDRLVDPGNADFVQSRLGEQAEVVRIADAGHFILWNRPEVIRQAILQHLEPEPALFGTVSSTSGAAACRRRRNSP